MTTASTSRNETPQGPDSAEARRELGRERILNALAASKLNRLQERVAWILNNFPETRDSDLALQHRFWRTFDGLGSQEHVDLNDMYGLTRLTSLSRARAKIQNEYKLFRASPEVRRFRGTLEEEEKERAVAQRATFPLYAIYTDESGKTADHLIVGSVWVLHPPEVLTVLRRIEEWKEDAGYNGELHFKKINNGNVAFFKDIVKVIRASTGVLSFKAISVERSGISDVSAALESLLFHLILEGVDHEHTTGRGPLPRRVQVWKDLEEPGRDKIFLADLAEKLRGSAATRFDNRLHIGEFAAVDSKTNALIQIADLYTSSLNRVLNADGARSGPKDEFADYLLAELGMPHGPTGRMSTGDMTVHVKL